jgi:hypothetical protein
MACVNRRRPSNARAGQFCFASYCTRWCEKQGNVVENLVPECARQIENFRAGGSLWVLRAFFAVKSLCSLKQ